MKKKPKRSKRQCNNIRRADEKPNNEKKNSAKEEKKKKNASPFALFTTSTPNEKRAFKWLLSLCAVAPSCFPFDSMGDVAALGILRPDPRPGVLWVPNRARRCLFGTPDHELAEKFLENETNKLEERNRERWNFDFIKGTPLEGGRFAWTPVSEDAAVEGKDDASSSSPSEKDRDDDDEGSTCAPSTDGKLSQKLITDFMRKRKLSSNQKEMTPEPRVKTRRRFST